MNYYFYMKSNDYNHKIFLKSNNEINFNCRNKYIRKNENIITDNINCNKNKILDDNTELFDKQKIILENRPFEYLEETEQFKIFELFIIS